MARLAVASFVLLWLVGCVAIKGHQDEPQRAKMDFSLIQKWDDKDCYNQFVNFIYEDAVKLDEQTAQYVRYLVLYNVPFRKRLDFIRALSGHVNQLSFESKIVPVEVLPNTQLSVVRLNIQNYLWDKNVYELLADADPYFHVKLVNLVNIVETNYDGPFPSEWFRGNNGRWRYVSKTQFQLEGRSPQKIVTDPLNGVSKRSVRSKFEKSVVAPYLTVDKLTREKIEFLTNHLQTNAPFLRADWFIYQTAAQNDRTPGYYDFVRVKDRATFEQIIGFDEGLLRKSKRFELLEAVARSGVSQQPRRLAVYNTVGDLHYWRTFDAKLAKDEKNPLRVLDNNFQHDAEESFGSLPNGFWVWGLFDANGVRQNSAPDFIGYDHFSGSNDGRIEICISCMRCHYNHAIGGTGGLIQFRAWARNIFKNGFRLQSIDRNALADLERFYFRSMDTVTRHDIDQHNVAVKEATGLTADEWANSLIRYFNIYAGDKNIEDLATDLCMDKIELRNTLIQYAKGETSYQKMQDVYGIEKLRGLDLVLAGLVQGETIGETQYAEVFPLAAFICKNSRGEK